MVVLNSGATPYTKTSSILRDEGSLALFPSCCRWLLEGVRSPSPKKEGSTWLVSKM